MKNKLLTYEEVLLELHDSKNPNNLLLGNGFNLSLGVNTSYKNIFEVMKNNNKDYSIIQSKRLDLEEFIGECKKNIIKDNQPYTDFLTTFLHNKIKLDFMKAVTEIVTKEIKTIYQEKNEELYLLFKNFDNFFTLNYDPFLYQLLMKYKTSDEQKYGLLFNNSSKGKEILFNKDSKILLKEIEEGYKNGTVTIIIDNKPVILNLNKLSKTNFTNEIKTYYKDRTTLKELKKIIDLVWIKKEEENSKCLKNLNDGFGNLFGKELVYSAPNTQNLFFIHGAFHIHQSNNHIKKITQQTDKALYNRIEEIIENGNENIICIFDNNNKEIEINKNEYLKKGLNKLENLEGSVLLIGSSLADNDSHIFCRINNSNVDKIYIACSEDNSNETFRSATKFFPNKTIVLFDQFTISYKRTR